MKKKKPSRQVQVSTIFTELQHSEICYLSFLKIVSKFKSFSSNHRHWRHTSLTNRQEGTVDSICTARPRLIFEVSPKCQLLWNSSLTSGRAQASCFLSPHWHGWYSTVLIKVLLSVSLTLDCHHHFLYAQQHSVFTHSPVSTLCQAICEVSGQKDNSTKSQYQGEETSRRKEKHFKFAISLGGLYENVMGI